MQAANRRKTIGLLMGMGALMWVVVYAALTYFGGTGAGIVPIAVGISLISVWGRLLWIGQISFNDDRCQVNSRV